jgi:tagaturonate epimerase
MVNIEWVNEHQTRYLKIVGELPTGFEGTQQGDAWLCPMNAQNAKALREWQAWTAPVPVGMKKSVGCGDRLGLATLGHLRAIADGDMFPVLAQQSIREMQRSQRSAQQVLDDVTWAVFQANHQTGYGCDADHLKNTAVVDECIEAGFVGFTIDPGEYVDDNAHTDSLAVLEEKYQALPWDTLKINPQAFLSRYVGRSIVGQIEHEAVLRAACKYAKAIAHVANLSQHIAQKMAGKDFDLEVSVDETATPTHPIEHWIIAFELMRVGVPFKGLAPRFIGDFEKGVDYIGDLSAFEDAFEVHARIARELGPYKLSIHSGSDKFSIYPIIAKHANPYVHLKTAGTSWLEALRVIAHADPALMREMLDSAMNRYPTDRASYHVSADLAQLPQVSDAQLPNLMDDFHARQILHVTFGSLLANFREPFFQTLQANINQYYDFIEIHFNKHIQPFKA